MLEFAEQLDTLSKVGETHPIDDNAETFTLDIGKSGSDEPNVDRPAMPITIIHVVEEPRGLDGRPVGDKTSEPNGEPESIPVTTPTPGRPIVYNGDRAHCRRL